MTITGEALRELHRIHRQLSDLNSRLARGPKMVQAAKQNVSQLDEKLEQTKQTTKSVKMAADQRQLQLRSSEENILKLQGKMNACSSNREFQTLKDQIAADEMANSVLSDEILELLEKIDLHEEAIARITSELEKCGIQRDSVIARVDKERGQLEAEIARVQQLLDESESGLPGDFRIEYDRVVKVRGEETLAEVDGESCGGCYQRITHQMVNELMLAKPVFCKSCGRLLYFPEDRSVTS